MNDITDLSKEDREIVASSWGLKLNRNKAAYYKLLDYVKAETKDIKELPFFVVEMLTELGYQTPLIPN